MDKLSKEEVVRYLDLHLKNWTFNQSAIQRKFEFHSFVDAFSFMTGIALVIEKTDHHPDWSNSYNKVDISLSTHSAKGVTQLDLDLAKMIDGAYRRFEKH
jgi:4a-hydroxytetrahydrobiopterin dehydratase